MLHFTLLRKRAETNRASLIELHERAPSARLIYPIIFSCFFVSGFCSLLYQVVWTRLAFADFGIITPVLSLIISVFMLGLGVGSFYGGRIADSAQRKLRLSPLYLYAAAETLVATGAFAVPATFNWCRTALLHAGATSSATFLLLSAACIVIALLPWCVAMGATLPLMMTYAGGIAASDSTSFSFLYAANVLGAAAGAGATALVLIELFGLSGTSMLGASANMTIAALAMVLAISNPGVTSGTNASVLPAVVVVTPRKRRWVKAVLFITGFSSVGMEVCWARDFTLTLLTTIYAFAGILATYLCATFVGSMMYRSQRSRNATVSLESCVAWLFPLSLLPVLLTDPRTDRSAVQTLLSIVPLCGLLGFLTPALIDRFARGDPRRAGLLYCINIIGGILGPLFAGYLALPRLGIRWAIIALALPLLLVFVLTGWSALRRHVAAVVMSALTAGVAVFFSRAYDDASLYPRGVARRDYAASVVAYGSGRSAQLLVNAIPITSLTTDTKEMAHLPMALRRQPRTALDICFGMGTTFRSLASWGVDTTAVDLSSSVIESFGFFHADAAAVLANPRTATIVDDGRRYLMRTGRQFDVITLDPPPPVEAAGSSLLYSVTFYEIAKRRLTPGGILAQWVPYSEARIAQSVALALHQSFPYVLIFRATYGFHLIASRTPVVVPSVREFLRRMPPAALRDMVEWDGPSSPQAVVRDMLGRQVPLRSLLPAPGADIRALSDDRPYNEYFFLRRSGWAG